MPGIPFLCYYSDKRLVMFFNKTTVCKDVVHVFVASQTTLLQCCNVSHIKIIFWACLTQANKAIKLIVVIKGVDCESRLFNIKHSD